MDGLDGWMRVCNTHTRTHTRPCTEGSVSLTQLRHQSLICFVVKAVLFLISVVMERLRCHTTLEVSFCTWNKKEKKSHRFCCGFTAAVYIYPFIYLALEKYLVPDSHFVERNISEKLSCMSIYYYFFNGKGWMQPGESFFFQMKTLTSLTKCFFFLFVFLIFYFKNETPLSTWEIVWWLLKLHFLSEEN